MGDRVTGGRRLKPRPFPLLSKGVFATGAEPSRTRVCWRRERILDGEHQSPQCKVQGKARLRPGGIFVTYVAGRYRLRAATVRERWVVATVQPLAYARGS